MYFLFLPEQTSTLIKWLVFYKRETLSDGKVPNSSYNLDKRRGHSNMQSFFRKVNAAQHREWEQEIAQCFQCHDYATTFLNFPWIKWISVHFRTLQKSFAIAELLPHGEILVSCIQGNSLSSRLLGSTDFLTLPFVCKMPILQIFGSWTTSACKRRNKAVSCTCSRKNFNNFFNATWMTYRTQPSFCKK